MAASKDDYFKKVGRATATTLSSPGYTIGDSTINTGATTNWPVDTGVTFAIDEVGSDGLRISGTYNVFNGVVSGAGQVSQVEYIGGDPNRDYSAGATTRVYILVSAYRDNQFTDGILVHANQNGTLKDTAIPANSIDNSNIKTGAAIDGTKFADTSIPTAKYQDASVTPAKISNPYKFSAHTATTSVGASATLIKFGTEYYDTNSNYDPSTGLYTAPVNGFYRFSSTVVISTSNGGNNTGGFFLYKNGSNIRNLQNWAVGAISSFVGGTASFAIQLTAGNTISIYMLNSIPTSFISTVFEGELITLT